MQQHCVYKPDKITFNVADAFIETNIALCLRPYTYRYSVNDVFSSVPTLPPSISGFPRQLYSPLRSLLCEGGSESDDEESWESSSIHRSTLEISVDEASLRDMDDPEPSIFSQSGFISSETSFPSKSIRSGKTEYEGDESMRIKILIWIQIQTQTQTQAQTQTLIQSKLSERQGEHQY